MNTSRALLPVLLVLGGCALTGRQNLDEISSLFHDDLRWGRLPAAGGLVDDAVRAAFNTHHRAWGNVVHVQDVEVEAMQANGDHGTVRLRVVWLRGDDSTVVRESVVEEQWETRSGAWRLRNESVIAGDPGLFGTPAA